jgi:glycosyltransferase involved in cell wall biosynthesis
VPEAVARIGVVLSTYDQPDFLRLALLGYAGQTRPADEILIADDGSGPATAALLDAMAGELGLPLVHVHHPDRGFRKTLALNRAVLAAVSDYLVFSDGDCIPHPGFLEGHCRLARPGRFVSGGYLKLPERVTEAVTEEAVRTGRVFDPAWLRGQGWRPGRRAFRLAPEGARARFLDRITPTRATWNGHNSATFREHLLQVNGFDLDMEWGGEDRALGMRLGHLGVRGVQARHRLPVVHLHHGRPYVRDEALRKNAAIRERIRRRREVRARLGLAEIDPEEGVTLRTPGGRS